MLGTSENSIRAETSPRVREDRVGKNKAQSHEALTRHRVRILPELRAQALGGRGPSGPQVDELSFWAVAMCPSWETTVRREEQSVLMGKTNKAPRA